MSLSLSPPLPIEPSLPAGPVRRLREWEFWFLALAAAVLYLPRLTEIPIRGEESRRAGVACEMLQTGDWVVPRQQGMPFLSRPPLANYPIALATLLLGDCSLLAVRLPTVLATGLTALLIYGYGRTFLSRLGAFAAGLAYLTMGQVLQLGRFAETEATFTLLLAGSLLVWHWGYSRLLKKGTGTSRRRGTAGESDPLLGANPLFQQTESQGWRPVWPWLAGYGLAALAALAKGPQAPLYFAGPVWLFLVWRRDWRTLWSWSHLAGVALFAAVIGAWQGPFIAEMGWPATRAIWAGDVAMRFIDMRWQRFVEHLLAYPFEVAICTLPWSVLLIPFTSRNFRRTLGDARPWVVFLGIALAVSYPTCWIPPGARGRYFMPLFPCLALLAGLIVQRAVAADASRMLRRTWFAFLVGMAATAILGGLFVASASWTERLESLELRQPGWLVALYGAAALAAAVLLWANRDAAVRPIWPRTALLATAAFLGLTYSGIIVNHMLQTSENAAPLVAELKEKRPPDTRLVSFGQIASVFAYHYREPIEARPWPRSARAMEPDFDYFCFNWNDAPLPSLPFSWTVVGTVPWDRLHHCQPQGIVIVALRLDAVASRPALRR